MIISYLLYFVNMQIAWVFRFENKRIHYPFAFLSLSICMYTFCLLTTLLTLQCLYYFNIIVDLVCKFLNRFFVYIFLKDIDS